MDSHSLLPLVAKVDNFSPSLTPHPFARLYLDSSHTNLIGLVPPSVHSAILDYQSQHPAVFSFSPDGDRPLSRLCFVDFLNTFSLRTEALQSLLLTWHTTNLFAPEIGGRKWRNELYTIYRHPYRQITPENAIFAMERSACKLFGVVTYGVHMTMYRRDEAGEVKVWVPTRSRNKQTWPLYLDNSVAGGIPHGITPLESMIKECEEEASLPPQLVKKHIKQVSSISYFYQTAEGWLEPEVQYVYELFIPEGVEATPAPSDGEVESFEMCTLDEILAKMREDKFKPNCGAVIVDFLIRHGYLTAENEPNYLEIITRLHRRAEGYGPQPTGP